MSLIKFVRQEADGCYNWVCYTRSWPQSFSGTIFRCLFAQPISRDLTSNLVLRPPILVKCMVTMDYYKICPHIMRHSKSHESRVISSAHTLPFYSWDPYSISLYMAIHKGFLDLQGMVHKCATSTKLSVYATHGSSHHSAILGAESRHLMRGSVSHGRNER